MEAKEVYTYRLNLARFGTAEEDYVRSQLEAFWLNPDNDFEYTDNFRLARKGDADDEAAYEETRRGGCCGYHDIEIGPSPGGYTYLYGFNFGHF